MRPGARARPRGQCHDALPGYDLQDGSNGEAGVRRMRSQPGDDLLRDRRAGVLLHISSLPGPEGIGCLDANAHRFIKFLQEAGFAAWQVLPVNPPGPGWSPYAAQSSFAGNPLFVSIAALAEDGLLSRTEAQPPAFAPERAAFDEAAAWKERLLRLAFDRLDPVRAARVDALAARSPWLEDWALFAALSDRHGAPWQEWPPRLARHEPDALAEARAELAGDVRYHRFVQWAFERQWKALHARANEAGIVLFGDLPIFPALHSADVWANQQTFKLDARGYPHVVAGVPPDYFSATGQRWGNPHYAWDTESARGFPYWTARLQRAFELYGVLRIDHFRGFEAAWEIPAEAATAIEGRWQPGPGAALFESLAKRLGPMNIVVEDLGVITPEVHALREHLGYPGLLVLQFAFDGDATNAYLPANHRERAVVYTGTHDNDTTAGWWASLDRAQRRRVRELSGLRFRDPVGDLTGLALESRAALAVLPMQDLLGLGSKARMNTPSTGDGNWTWRFDWRDVPEGLAGELRARLEAANRSRARHWAREDE